MTSKEYYFVVRIVETSQDGKTTLDASIANDMADKRFKKGDIWDDGRGSWKKADDTHVGYSKILNDAILQTFPVVKYESVEQ